MGLFGKTKVHMILSVDNHVAGKNYRLPKEKADDYIIKQYASGKLSRPYSDVEVADKTRTTQVVGT